MWVFLPPFLIVFPWAGPTLPRQTVRVRWDETTCSAQDRSIVQGHVLSSLALPFGKKETVAPELSYLADFFSGGFSVVRGHWRSFLLQTLPDLADRQDYLWANHSQSSSCVTPNFQPSFEIFFFFQAKLKHSGCSSLFLHSLLFQVRQMKKPLPRSADGEDNTPCLASRPTLACWSLTNLPVPPNMPIITIVMRWKNKIEAGLQAAWRLLFIYQVRTSMLMRNAQKRIHQLVKSQNQKAKQEVVAVCWLNVSSPVDNDRQLVCLHPALALLFNLV